MPMYLVELHGGPKDGWVRGFPALPLRISFKKRDGEFMLSSADRETLEFGVEIAGYNQRRGDGGAPVTVDGKYQFDYDEVSSGML